MHIKRRHRWLMGLMAMGVMVVAVRMAVPAQAQTTANGPYYATPSWDQTLPAASRFIILSNFNSEAVLDRNTGLVWEKSPNATPETWSNARFSCANRTTGGQKGWRVPSMPELASLIDPSVAFPGPALPPGHPFIGVLSALYWSASTSAENPAIAWLVLFDHGIVSTGGKAGSVQVWCVRGGMTADAY